MKRYSVYALKVVKVGTGDNTRYLICKYNELTDTYIEVLTNEKLMVSDKTCVEPLSNYYSILSQCNYTTGQPLMLDKKALLQKYIDINSELTLVHNEEKLESKSDTLIPVDANSTLEKATLEFFPKTGEWYSNCFRRPTELGMGNLPCHLRDDVWLAKMLKKDQNLFYMSHSKVLNFVRNSEFFKEKRHEYELEIVKWQIQWIAGGGENWICDDNYGGDFINFSTVCDLGFRKGVVDKLTKIGMSKEAIEEGIERNVHLWRDSYMNMAFRNEFDPVFIYFNPFNKVEDLDINKPILEKVDPKHKEAWLKLRRYEYYQRHKTSVDKYGIVMPEMKMSVEEASKLAIQLDEMNLKRKTQIKEYEEARNRVRAKRYESKNKR